jgi:hypothetical protein
MTPSAFAQLVPNRLRWHVQLCQLTQKKCEGRYSRYCHALLHCKEVTDSKVVHVDRHLRLHMPSWGAHPMQTVQQSAPTCASTITIQQRAL